MALAEPESAKAARSGDNVIRHGLVYSLAPLLRYAVSMGMTRFYTFSLKTSLYGVKEMVDLWMILLQQLLGMNLLTSMVRFYYDRRDERERAAVVTSTTLCISLAAWLVCGTALFFSKDLSQILIASPSPQVSAHEIDVAFRFLVVLIPFQLATLSGLYYLQTIKRSTTYTLFQTVKFAVEVGMHVLFMGVLDWGLKGFLTGLLIGEVLASSTLAGWMLIKLGARIDWRIFKPILVYAAPLIPVGVFQLGLHQLDRRLIEYTFRGQAEGLDLVGIYGLGYKVGQLVNMLCIWPFMQIWQPTIYGVEEPQERSRLVARVTTWMVVAISVATLLLIYGGRQAVDLLAGSDEYLSAYTVVPWVGAGYVFWALYSSAQMPLYLAKRTVPLFWINLAALLFCVGANLVLIPRLRILGAAYATLLTFALLGALVMYTSRAIAAVPFELRRLGLTFAVVIGSCVLVRWLDAGDPYRSASVLALHLSSKGLALVLSLCALWYGVLSPSERGRVADALRSRLGRFGRATP